MRKSLFGNIPINATFTIKGVSYRKNSPTTAIALSGVFVGSEALIGKSVMVNYHKHKPISASHSNTDCT